MSLLLPSVTARVASPQSTLDPHGAETVHAWTERGPYPAHVGRAQHSEDVLQGRTVTGWQVDLDPAAWPLTARDRVLVVETGQVLEVTGARQVPDLAGAGVAHVVASCVEIAGAV